MMLANYPPNVLAPQSVALEYDAMEWALAAAIAAFAEVALAAGQADRAARLRRAVSALRSAENGPGTPDNGCVTVTRLPFQLRLLTAREREVAALIARGLTNRQIADVLHITTRTASTHVQHILSKLGLRSRAEVALWFMRLAEAGRH
jgi:DNA-binding NarL/FixJ family response regulator